ncbi:MAG: hypothetical protein R2785_09525 [Flavobacteriaceae bacterium]
MGNKKDIGKILNEQLSNLSKSPHDKVWDNIEAELKKSKRRIFPFWLWYIGAGLIIISTLSILVYNSYVLPENEQSNPSIVNEKSIDNNVNQKTNELLESQNNSTINANLTSTKIDSLLITTQENQFVKTNSTKKTLNTSNNINISINNSFITSPNKNYLSNNDSHLRDYSNHINSKLFLEGYSVVFLETPIDINIKSEENPIIPIEIKKPKKAKKTETKNDIMLKTYIEPTYFSTLEKGSSIDEDLISNDKLGAISIGYGAAIIYEFSKKSRISLGISRANLSYITKNADSTNSNGQLMRSYGFNRLNITRSSEEISAKLGSLSAIDLKQKISLWEVPIEYSYKLIDNKISFKTYGGVSFISLIEDSIIAESSNGNSFTIGNVTNVGKISASLNFGVGLGYDLSDKIELFAEPIFKYYSNIFNQSDNFKPYSLSTRFGIIYKFSY